MSEMRYSPDVTYSDAPLPLTSRERNLVRRIFSDWFEVPGEWKGSLRSYLESDPPVLGKAALGGGALAVNGSLGDETSTPFYVNINGEMSQVRVGPPGSGPDGQGRALWVE